MISATSSKKKIILGTALWGWGVTRVEAFNLLESFFKSGGVVVDTATNYPINKCKKDFGLAVRWLAEWAYLHPNEKFSLIVKVGSKNNLGGQEFDLSPNTIIETTKRLRDTFGNSLSCISIHWDDRVDGNQGQDAIAETVEAMSKIRKSGLDIGFSGIKDPQRYYLSDPVLATDWIIQVKENFLTNTSRLLYERYFPNAQYLAYGINMGGVKLEKHSGDSSINLRGIKIESSFVDKAKILLESNHGIDPSPANLNHLSLAFVYFNASLAGVIIGPRNVEQLENSLCYWARLEKSDSQSGWADLFNAITRID